MHKIAFWAKWAYLFFFFGELKETWRVMKEKVFTTEVVRSLENEGHYAYKIPDSPASQGMNMGFLFAKPCDIVAGVYGEFVGIETKIMNKFEAFSLNHMRPSQIKHLTMMIEAGSKAFVFLNVRISSPFPSKRVNRLIVFEWSALHERLKISSIKKNELIAHAHTGKENGFFDFSLFYAQLVTSKDF